LSQVARIKRFLPHWVMTSGNSLTRWVMTFGPLGALTHWVNLVHLDPLDPLGALTQRVT
jgi:hypothetical protein